jgi:hypothetical protein
VACELQLVREGEDVLRPGDPYEATAIVRCDEALTAARIHVFAKLFTGSASFSARRQTSREVVYVGPIDAGTHRFSIRLTAPAYPPNYEGAHLSFQWRLHAELEAGSVRRQDYAELDVRSEPSEQWALVPNVQGRPDAVHPKDPNQGRGLALVLGLISLGALGLIAWEIQQVAAGAGDGGIAGLAAMLSIAFAVAYFNVRGRMKVRRLLGVPQVVVEHDLDRQTLRCDLWTRAPGPRGEVRAHLAVREETTEPNPRRAEGKIPIRFVLWETTTKLEPTEPGHHSGTLDVTPSHPLPPLVDGHERGLVWRLWVTVLDEVGVELTKIERRLDAAVDGGRS